jgi:zinc transport system ATP-binding protein
VNELDPILVLSGLTVRRRERAILWDVSTHVQRGSIHVIAGPNGAGKTTLLMTVLAQAPFSGRIVAHWRRSGAVGYVPQTFNVDRALPVTVADFLALTRQRRPVCFGISRRVRERIAELLAAADLSGFENRPLSALSGGELRRVLLVHALNPVPELLILDEPATGLDERAGRRLEETLLTMSRRNGVSVLMVSHDFEQARRIADRVTVLDRTVVADGRAGDTLSRLPR